MHFTCELKLNRVPPPEDADEMKMFLSFVRGLEGYTAYRTEWEIFGEEERLAGSIDFVAEAIDGTLILVDWKRTKCLNDKYSNHFRTMKLPLAHLDDCAGSHYRLQLNLYKYVLGEYEGKTGSRMLVVGAKPDNCGEAFVDEVPFMREEAEVLMQWQRSWTTQ